MPIAVPLLEGTTIRLESLAPEHVVGLAEAASQDPSLYRFSPVPQGLEPLCPTSRRPWRPGRCTACSCTPTPASSIRETAIERVGASFEGILRAHRAAAEGGPRDSARYSITATEWPRVKAHLAALAARHQEST
jgi:hypothetical protein